MGNSYYQAYIGTNSVRGSRGIYCVRIDAETFEPELIAAEQAYNSGSVALDQKGKFLYAASEGMTFEGYADGGVSAYEIGMDGTLKKLGGQRTYGQRTCCVAVDEKGENVYACNFYKGTFSAFPVADKGGLYPAKYVIKPPAETGWKALHCVAPIGDGYIGVISLAECALVIYRAKDGERITSYTFPGNPFPRYFETAGSHIYAMMQMPDDIYVFEERLNRDGSIRLVQKISVMDQTYQGMAATSTLRATPDGRLLLAANRPSDSITVFERRQDGRLERKHITRLPGRGPRDFHISGDGRIVVAALQHSDEISVHEIDYEKGSLTQRGKKLSIPSPAAVAISGRIKME
ncbi:MAG: lactonase family protein [Lachnospiraceae bacterium]|jgi:6-phosphogluconolactonase|nr:lactonase family protein [Lachnospiraceae bacterium]